MSADLSSGLVSDALDLSSLTLAITEHSPLPMATVEGATHIVRYGNPAFCRLMNMTCEAIIGQPLSELLPEKAQCVTLLDRVFLTSKPESYTELEGNAENPIFWSYTIWPLRTTDHLVGIMIQVTETAKLHKATVAMNEALLLGSLLQHELTEQAELANEQLRAEILERTRAEGALRESEERFRSLFAAAPMAVFACDLDGVLQNYNRRAVELWGREPEKGVERQSGSQRLWLPDGTALLNDRSPVVGVLRTGIAVENLEVHIERPDQSRLPVSMSIAPLFNAQGGITGAISSFMDITERRALEDSLVERAMDLVRAGRSKDEFLAMLAHELRNPLAPLRNAMEILRAPDATEASRDQAQRIAGRQIENMTRMIDDLLDVSGITEGKIEMQTAVINLEGILTSAAGTVRPAMEVRHQKFTMRLPADPVFLKADPTRLEQVFTNLLGNACKYSGPGCPISISAEREMSPAGTPDVVVRVCDEGIGIAPEVLPRVFELFVQANRGLDRAYGGLGIGLTLVERLVILHGGTVEAQSEGLGCGSEFTVRLPLVDAPVSIPAPPLPAPAREVPRRMLIVDDNIDSARSMSTLQSLRGHQTRMALTGPDAVAVAAEFLPEVVLLDIGLPGMDGFAVARELRAMPGLGRVFIVAMTGYGSAEDRTRAAEAGFDEYLVKPVDLDLLREWLHQRS